MLQNIIKYEEILETAVNLGFIMIYWREDGGVKVKWFQVLLNIEADRILL